mgnify:CR=1 FL=1
MTNPNTEYRNIGLSLGADLCWPAAFEELLKQLNPVIPYNGKEIRFQSERVTIEPFDLQYKPKYDLVLDRVTHWYHISREWIKKITLMDGVYVLNNPWAIQSVEKHTSYCAMMRLGLPIPQTWMIPPKEYSKEDDLQTTVHRYNKLFNLKDVGQKIGYPAFLKPYDGGGWVGVKQVKNDKQLDKAYDESGERVHHLQAGVKNWDVFVRGIGIGPQVNVIRYDPAAPLHARYMIDFHYLNGEEWKRATQITRIINAFFGWDFNSCEMLRSKGILHPIDFANACPDSQITSLHFHFPWLVKSLLRWSIFCSTTKRKPRLTLNWEPYLEIADNPDLSLDEKIEAYDVIAKEHFDVYRFHDFNEQHLQDLDEVALEFFQTQKFRDIIHDKVASLYPAHEIESFTDHFFGLVQFWCKTEKDRLNPEVQ